MLTNPVFGRFFPLHNFFSKNGHFCPILPKMEVKKLQKTAKIK
jgi:hypothetical protein